MAAIKFGVSPPPVYAVYDRRIYWRRQILAKTRNSPNSPNIIARQNLLIYSIWFFSNSQVADKFTIYRFKDTTKSSIQSLRVCYGTFCRPCTICRRRQIVPTLAAHFVAPLHNLTPGDKMCCSGRYVWGRQNVPCKSAHFVVPHWMDLNIQ